MIIYMERQCEMDNSFNTYVCSSLDTNNKYSWNVVIVNISIMQENFDTSDMLQNPFGQICHLTPC